MKTLVKTLNVNIDSDIPKLGVLSLNMKNINNYIEPLQLYSVESYKIKCISGTLYNSNKLQTVELTAGDEKTYSGSKYFYFDKNSEVVIEISNAYKLGILNFKYIKPSQILLIETLAKYIDLFELINRTTHLTGRLEDYISRASDYGKTSDITITNDWVYFGTNKEIHGKTYYCDFATDSNVVTIKDTNTLGSVLGSYNKTTKVWTYAST